MRLYCVQSTALYDEQWHPVPEGYAARSVRLRCSPGCTCHSDPRLQLAAVRAIIDADRARAADSRRNYERRQAARAAAEVMW